MKLQKRPSKSSSFYQLICILFVITQTLLMIIGFSISFGYVTLAFIGNIILSTYEVLHNYSLGIILWLLIVIVHKIRLKMDKFLGNILEKIMAQHIKCHICNQGECDYNCKYCRLNYHQACLQDGVAVCVNPTCKQKLAKEKPQDIVQFLKLNPKFALYVGVIFVIYGLYPSFRDAYGYFFSSDQAVDI